GGAGRIAQGQNSTQVSVPEGVCHIDHTTGGRKCDTPRKTETIVELTPPRASYRTSEAVELPGCEASVNSRNSPLTTNAICSPMSTVLSPIRSLERGRN